MIKVIADKSTEDSIREAMIQNGGYCPCSTIHDDDHKCMCKEFREMNTGVCHCGLYEKVVVNSSK